MKKLYYKSQLWFSILLILIYVVGNSLSNAISTSLQIEQSVTFIFNIILSVVLFSFVKRENLKKYYGICKPEAPPSKFLYYIPLVILASVNLWFGIKINMPLIDTICYVGSMILVGAIEELIFRGFLFKAMCKDNVKTAIILSSLLFGIGHIVNLFNSNQAELVANICQVFYAIAIGFLFVTIFYRGLTLIPCMITHSILNLLSVFSNEAAAIKYQIPVAIILCIVSIVYAAILIKNLPIEKSCEL